MMTSLNSSAKPKRDLHVGGVGSSPSVGLSTVAGSFKEPRLIERSDEYVRANPWLVVGMAGLIGLAAGHWLSRRF